MKRKTNRGAAETAPLLHKEEATELDGQPIKYGDPVKVRNPPDKHERFMRGSWTFRALVTNRNGDSWVEVFGGKQGHEMGRSFPVERIDPITTKRKRKPTSSST